MVEQQEVARLTGRLVWSADNTKLRAFQAALQRVSQQMAGVGKSFDALQRKLNGKLGIKVGDNTAQREKLDKQVRASLDREIRGEVLLQKARKATMAADLQQRKLSLATTKETAYTASQELLAKRSQAILDAKQYKAEQERLKANGIELKQAQSLEANKVRQARLAEILKQQQQRTILLQQKQVSNMTNMQRAELALNQARERGMRAAKKFTDQQAASKIQAERRDIAHDQRQQRFAWASQRQAAWAARQNQPEPKTGFLGLGTGALAVGGAAAGVAGIVAAIDALGSRITATQARVADSQQYKNTLVQAGGANPANQKFAMEEFFRISDKYGTSADIDAAKNYRTFLLAELARGKSISQATRTFEIRQSAFSGAAMSREEQVRANLQLQQIASKGQGDREDLNTFSESAPLLVEPIRRAWAERNKHALDKNLEKDFRNSTTQGNLKAEDFTRGIEIFVRENAAAIERQSESIQANNTRLENAKYLQQAGLDQNPELIDAINERLKSEIELNGALLPLKETAIKVDTALNKLAASFLRWTIGKDATPEDAAQKVEGLSPDKPAIDPASFNGPKLDGELSPIQDPVDRLYNYFFGKSKPDIQRDQEAPQADSGLTDSDQWRPIIRELPKPMSAYDVASAQARVAQNTMSGMLKPDGTPAATTQEPVVNNDNSTHTTVESPRITVNVTAPAGLDEQKVAQLARKEFENVFSKYMPSEAH